MKVEDFFVQGRRGWVRLHEKGGKEHVMPTHHNLDRYLEEYLSAAGIADDRKSPLFRTTRGQSGELTVNPILQSDVWRMIRRRALAAGIKTEIGCHTFRATGITVISKMAASWRLQSRWRRTSPPEQLAYMIGAMTKSRWMKLSGSESDATSREILNLLRWLLLIGTKVYIPWFRAGNERQSQYKVYIPCTAYVEAFTIREGRYQSLVSGTHLSRLLIQTDRGRSSNQSR